MSKSENGKKKSSSSGHLSEAIEQELETLPNMKISLLKFQLLQDVSKQDGKESSIVKNELMDLIKENNMNVYYESLCQEAGWKVDVSLLDSMKQHNQDKLQKIQEQLQDVQENLGDIEILEACYAKATTYTKMGDKANALKAFEESGKRPQSLNQKIQVALHIVRLGLFFSDVQLVQQYIEKARKLIDEGGDWDRRNRLKVNEACYFMMARNFQDAASLFQDSIATFTSVEVMSYNHMIFYCILTSVLSLSRVELKKKIVDCPEVLTVIRELPHLTEFLSGLYDCDYKKFFTALVDLQPYIAKDKYLSEHSQYLYRELRVLAYTQFLEAYRSVTMDSMSRAFGVGKAFLDRELSRFISTGRLNAKIDKVNDVIETNRPDAKNAQYQEIIKKGDLLLNRVQKLARVINV